MQHTSVTRSKEELIVTIFRPRMDQPQVEVNRQSPGVRLGVQGFHDVYAEPGEASIPNGFPKTGL